MVFSKTNDCYGINIENPRNFTVQLKFRRADEIIMGIQFPTRGQIAWEIKVVVLKLQEKAVSIGPIVFKMEKGDKELWKSVSIHPIPPFAGALKVKLVVTTEKACTLEI